MIKWRRNVTGRKAKGVVKSCYGCVCGCGCVCVGGGGIAGTVKTRSFFRIKFKKKFFQRVMIPHDSLTLFDVLLKKHNWPGV